MHSEESPLISIITVVLNDKKGIEVTSSSILSSKSSRIEYIVVDGQSKDGTAEFCHTLLMDERVKFISSKPNGIYNAMNIAANSARGNWLLYINASDKLLPGAIEFLVKELDGLDLKYGLVGSPVIHTSKTGFIFDISFPQIICVGSYKIASLNHQGALVSRDIFLQIKGFNENLKLAADGMLLDKAASLTNHHFLKTAFVEFQLGGAASQNFSETLRETGLYRPSFLFESNTRILKAKDFLRRSVFSLETSPRSSWFLRKFLQHRQKQITASLDSKIRAEVLMLREAT